MVLNKREIFPRERKEYTGEKYTGEKKKKQEKFVEYRALSERRKRIP